MMKVALIQFNATADKSDNIRRAIDFVQQAAGQKAKWILLPEIFNFRGDSRHKKILQQARERIPGDTTKTFLKLARQHKVDILLGSVLEKAPQAKAYNTSIAISGFLGEIVKYRKIHLFDAAVGDKIIHERETIVAGHKTRKITVGEFTAGLSICYDLRFPDLYQTYAHQGATVLTVPSCFIKQTGTAHWESLLRARAIENLCYVLAPAQVGRDARGIEAYGHSMIVDPWGEILACGSANKEEIVYGDIYLEKVREARRKLPGILNSTRTKNATH